MSFQQMLPATPAICTQNGPNLNPKLVYPAAVIVPDDLQLLNEADCLRTASHMYTHFVQGSLQLLLGWAFIIRPTGIL